MRYRLLVGWTSWLIRGVIRFEGLEDKVKDGVDAGPVLLGDGGRIGLSALDFPTVSVVKRLFACDLALVLVGAWYVGAPLDRAECSIREHEYVTS